MRRRVAEFVMYAAFSAAALLSAWLGVHNFRYFRAHPEMLEERDSAGEALALSLISPYVSTALVIGGLLALYFVAKGPRAARINIFALGIALVATLVLTPSTSFTSFARIYWDGATSVLLCALPLVCAAFRARMA